MKTRNLTQSSLLNDPINCWMHGFSFRLFEDEIEVRDVISPLSLSQSNLDFKHSLDAETSQEYEEIKLALELVSGQFEFLKNSRVNLSVTKNTLFKDKIGRSRQMKRHIAINGRDEASFDLNGAIKLHPSDQRSRVEVSPRVVCEEARRLISCVRSWSGDLDLIEDP